MGLINWKAVREKRSFELFVDLVMLVLAVVHLTLIAFDTTYFSLRSFYFHYLPSIQQTYDPLKGVEPHRFTTEYMQKSADYFKACHQKGEVSLPLQLELTQLSFQMITENPFERAQQTGELETIKHNMRKFTGVKSSSKSAFEAFWKQGCNNLAQREAFFEKEVAYYMKTNYWRHIDRNGRPTDHFFLIDLAFISLFLLEFLISWFSAIRRFGKDQKVLYPLYHWYDLLSCIPLRELRMLRLLRILAVYYRLIQSDIISLEDNPIYKRVIRFKSIIEEEISDQVALNILSNIQEKTRLGTNRELLKALIAAYHEPIKTHAVEAIQSMEIPTLDRKHNELVAMVSAMTYETITRTDDYQRLIQLPLMESTLNRVINTESISKIVDQSMEAFLDVLQESLRTPQMKEILNSLVDDILAQTVEISEDPTLQQLIEDISVQIIEELKKSSTAKIWKTQSLAAKDESNVEKIGEATLPETPDSHEPV